MCPRPKSRWILSNEPFFGFSPAFVRESAKRCFAFSLLTGQATKVSAAAAAVWRMGNGLPAMRLAEKARFLHSPENAVHVFWFWLGVCHLSEGKHLEHLILGDGVLDEPTPLVLC